MKSAAIVPIAIFCAAGLLYFFLFHNMQGANDEASKHLRDNHRDYEFETCIITRVRSLMEFTTCSYMEWMEYHLALGIDHIFISNECSPQPHFHPMLDYYASLGVLTDTSTKRSCNKYVPNEDATTKRNFKVFAQRRCRWVTAIDMDEYINILPVDVNIPKVTTVTTTTTATATAESANITTNLKEVLLHTEYPFIRMPWWVMGSDNHEKRPIGLTIDNYKHGSLIPYLIKSLAKSKELDSWSFQHCPHLSAANSKKVLFGNTTRGEYVTHLQLFEDEFVTVEEPALEKTHNTTGLTVSVSYPTNRIFLKHYVYLSYEEYSFQRAAYNKTSTNSPNIWNDNPRDKWLGGGLYVHSLNEEFTSIMGKKVKMALRKSEIHARSINASSIAVFEMCAPYWG